MTIRVRFAPSPTGYLHIGNVRTALFNHLFAKRNNGLLVLRIEDTDKERSKEEYKRMILKDLTWLGVEWDEGPDVGGPFGPYEQSKRLNHYQDAANRLLDEGKAYHCFCSTETLDQIKKSFQTKGLPPKYDNRCRKLSAEDVKRKLEEGQKSSIRFKLDEGELEFEDIVRGTVKFDLNLFGDLIIVRPDGMPTFHLAVCVDDGLMKITHVIRGEDHLSNTPRHILLFRALGFQPPQFAHVSLIMGKGGEPLSKRMGAMSVEDYRHQGYLPEVIDNYMALLGWSPGNNREIFSLDDLEKEFSLDRVGKSAAIFDPDKLNWLSGEHIRMLSDDNYVSRAIEYMKNEGCMSDFFNHLTEEKKKEVLLIFKDNISHFNELSDRLEIFDSAAPLKDGELLKREHVPQILAGVKEYLDSLPASGILDYDALNQKLKSTVKVKGKELYLPLRVALTFRAHGPEMKRILPQLSKDLCLNRLSQAEKIALGMSS